MELIIGLLVIAAVGYVVFFRKKDEYVAETTSAPYKVEQPVPAGDVAPQPEPAPVVVVAEGAGVVDIAAPVVEEAPAKKTRKPRAPKAEKPAAKKAAPKKAAAIKATKKSKKA